MTFIKNALCFALGYVLAQAFWMLASGGILLWMMK
jgi:hypothetical protein